MQVFGDPDFAYPVEVMAETICLPAEETTDLSVEKLPSEELRFCWTEFIDPCLLGYDVLGADAPESAENFETVGSVGLEGCWTGGPSNIYYLVVGRGTGGVGPWGHYSQ